MASSYQEWLNRKKNNEVKILDTVPRRTAAHHTEVVKRAATAVVNNRPTGQIGVDASIYTAFRGGFELRQAQKAGVNTKADRITEVCNILPEPTPRPKVTKCPWSLVLNEIPQSAPACTCGFHV